MYGVIRQGTMPVRSPGYGDAVRPASRLRTISGMKKQIEANNADIKLFEKQLKDIKYRVEKKWDIMLPSNTTAETIQKIRRFAQAFWKVANNCCFRYLFTRKLWK